MFRITFLGADNFCRRFFLCLPLHCRKEKSTFVLCLRRKTSSLGIAQTSLALLLLIRSLPTAKNFGARKSLKTSFHSPLAVAFFDLLIQNSSLGWSGYILEFWYSHIVLLIVFVSISRHSDAKAWPPVRVASFSHNEYRLQSL